MGKPANTDLRVLSDISFKGGVRIPFLNDHETYDKIVVVDDAKHLRIAEKPAAGGYDFSFADFITPAEKSFREFFPQKYDAQGYYHVLSDLYFSFLRSGLYVFVHRRIGFTVIVSPSILNFRHEHSALYLQHSGCYMMIDSGNYADGGEVPQQDISMSLTLNQSNKVIIQMQHALNRVDNLDFTAHVIVKHIQ